MRYVFWDIFKFNSTSKAWAENVVFVGIRTMESGKMRQVENTEKELLLVNTLKVKQ